MDDSRDIRIPTHAAQVSIRLAGGETLAGTLFLSRTSSFHEGPETLDEFLNSHRSFFALRGSDGRSCLIGAASVLLVSAGEDAPVLSRLPGRAWSTIEIIRLILVDGSTVEGTLRANLPPDRSRLSDVLNGEDAFVPIESAAGVVYVNKTAIRKLEL